MNILTFDIEDWFHILDNTSTKTVKEWYKYEPRIEENMERIFNLLDKVNVKATFFVLGWIAEKYPKVIKGISARGYEIGSHTTNHQLVYEQNENEFYNDVNRSIKTLEDLTGKKVKAFRAPGFSITEKNKWAFRILCELGIEFDSSIFPASRAHGGYPSFKNAKPSILTCNGAELKEFPMNTHKILGRPLIYSGGGYFRLTPYSLIKKWTKSDDYVMSYIHPRDLDANQPVIKELSIFRKFKSYVGLKSAEKKLEQWLTDFEFIDIATANKKIDWKKVDRTKIC